MAQHKVNTPEWRQFEKMVARIEADARPLGWVVKSPDRIRSLITGDLREVDASLRPQVGGSEVLITIECRKRSSKEDVTWIEQLATKKQAIGAIRTIAVSSAGFSKQAEMAAAHYGIDLRLVSDVSLSDLNQYLKLDLVLFNHKRCSIARVGFRRFQSNKWTVPTSDDVDFELSRETNPLDEIFQNTDTGKRFSLNHLWHEVQEACDPFADIERGKPAVVRTACFPYPGNVTVETPVGREKLGDVILGVALAIEVEMVSIENAKKISYKNFKGTDLQRIEFLSGNCEQGEWSVALQLPRRAINPEEVRVRLTSPDDQRRHGDSDE